MHFVHSCHRIDVLVWAWLCALHAQARLVSYGSAFVGMASVQIGCGFVHSAHSVTGIYTCMTESLYPIHLNSTVSRYPTLLPKQGGMHAHSDYI